MAIKYTYGMDAKAIPVGIKSIDSRSKTLRDNIQHLAVSILAHLKAHNDKDTAVRWANELHKALGTGARRDSLLAWFELHGPFVFNKETKMLVHGFSAASPVQKNSDIDPKAAAGNPWYEAKAEPDYKPIADVGVELDRLIKRLKADVVKQGEKSKVDPQVLLQLEALRKNVRA